MRNENFLRKYLEWFTRGTHVRRSVTFDRSAWTDLLHSRNRQNQQNSNWYAAIHHGRRRRRQPTYGRNRVHSASFAYVVRIVHVSVSGLKMWIRRMQVFDVFGLIECQQRSLWKRAADTCVNIDTHKRCRGGNFRACVEWSCKAGDWHFVRCRWIFAKDAQYLLASNFHCRVPFSAISKPNDNWLKRRRRRRHRRIAFMFSICCRCAITRIFYGSNASTQCIQTGNLSNAIEKLLAK